MERRTFLGALTVTSLGGLLEGSFADSHESKTPRKLPHR
jgi:hypothetical protein